MKKFLIGGGALVLVVGGVAFANGGNGWRHGPFGGRALMLQAADTNGDGAIARDEAVAMVTRHFAMVDTNSDGKVTREEIMTAREKRHAAMAARWGGRPGGPHGMFPAPGAMLARLDANDDGKLTRAEFDAPFDRIDANKDNIVDAAERQAMQRYVMPPPPSPASPPAPATNK